MTKFNTKYPATLALLLVVAIAPMSIAFAQTTATDPNTGATNSTDTDTTTDTTTDTRADEQKRKDKLKDEIKRIKDAITDKKKVVDKIRDTKADKIRDKIADRVRDKVIDRAPDLSYSGKTSGWAILGGTAFPSSIGISGQGYHLGGANWKITAVGDIVVADKTAKMDLTGHVRGNMINLHGTGTLSDGKEFKLHLKGHYAPTGNANEFAIAFTNSAIHYKDTGARMPLMQVGSVTVTPIVTPAPVPEPVPEPVPTTPAQ